MFTVPDATDPKLLELVSQGAARNIHDVEISDPTQGILEPEGMTLADEEEIEIMLELADAGMDGDERGAIDRLIDVLDNVPE
jgi:hypothetical protein